MRSKSDPKAFPQTEIEENQAPAPAWSLADDPAAIRTTMQS